MNAINSIRCGCGAIHPGGVHCGQPERDAELLRMLEPEIVYYGPYRCGCGAMICRVSKEQGGMAFDYPRGPIYPNTNWTQHVCEPKAEREPGHQHGCICADCSGAELTADND